jgi:hypothetical protein
MNLLTKLYRRGVVSAGVIALALVYLLKTTWFKWGDLVVDLGREVYVPARLAEGAVLYRDIFYLYGPFPPYFNAFLYKIFGTNILSLVIGGILVTTLTALLIYKLSRMFLDVFFATFTTVVFLFVLAFGHYVLIGNYNFILPYSYPATHAILFVLGALYFLFRSLDGGGGMDVWLAGAGVFLSLISRSEIGVMLALSIMAVVLILKSSGSKAPLFRPLVLFPVVGAVVVYGAFFAAAGPRIMQSNLLDLFKSNVQASPFSLLISGANASGQNIFLMFKSVFFYLLFALWFALAGYGASFAGRLQQMARRRLCYALIGAAALSGALIFLKTAYNLIIGIFSLVLYFRSGRKVVDLKLFTLSLFAFFVVMRIILYVHAWHYGFYILVPGLIVYHVFFFRTLPQLAHDKFMRIAFYAGFTLVLLVLMVDHVQASRSVYQHRILRVPSSRGQTSVFDNPQGRGVRDLIDFFSSKTPKDATLAVFPEGLMINFLAERADPLYYYTFLPQDMVRESVETAMVDDINLKKPDYVVILQRSVAEYGSRGFGVDYGKKILAHIEKNYTPFASIGPIPFQPDSFSAVIFKHNP